MTEATSMIVLSSGIDKVVLKDIFDINYLHRLEEKISNSISNPLSYQVTLPANIGLANMSHQLASGIVFDSNIPSDKPSTSAPKIMSGHMAKTILSHLKLVSTIAPGLIMTKDSLQLLQSGISREIIRFYIILYEWYTFQAPMMSRSMLSLYQLGQKDSTGEEDLRKEYPFLADIFLQVLHYLESWAGSKGPDATGETITITSDSLPDEIKPTQSSQLKLKLTKPDEYIPKKGQDAFHMRFLSYLEFVWSWLWIFPKLRELGAIDAKDIPDDTRKKESKLLKAYNLMRSKVIARGGIAKALLTGFGSDSIFAIPDVQDLLLGHLTKLFPNLDYKYEKLAKILISSEKDVFKLFVDWAESVYQGNFELRQNWEQIGKLVDWQMMQFREGKKITKAKFLERISSSHISGTNYQAIRLSHLSKRSLQFINSNKPLTVSDLLQEGLQQPKWSLLNVILRQAIRFYRFKDLKPTLDVDTTLRWVFLGCNLITGKELHPSEQTNPCREKTNSMRILREILPPSAINTRAGFATYVLWFVTGQSEATLQFAQTDPKVYESAEAALAKLNQAEAYNIKAENMRVWGTANKNLTWKSGYQTVSERVDMIFNFYPKWQNFSGFINGTKPPPGAYVRLKSWTETINWFNSESHIRGLGGLTLFHMVSDLAKKGFCQKPSAQEIGLWVHSHGKLGASRGLELLGFNVDYIDQRKTRAALSAVHNFLKSTLSEEDKTLLVFDVNFTEHILCKVTRWSSRYSRQKYSFVETAEKIAKSVPPWNSAGSKNNMDAFPCPSVSDPNILQFALNESINMLPIPEVTNDLSPMMEGGENDDEEMADNVQ